MRVPLGPNHALLFSWLNAPNEQAPRIRGTDAIAAQLNFAALDQADREWFHHPARRPTSLNPADLSSGPLRPLARDLLPGYSHDHALTSQRRSDAISNINDMIENGRHDELRIARVAAA